MPAYNAENTIKKAIDAIWNQTYKNWTLYIVNDGSTDKTSNVLTWYEKTPRIVILSTANHGVSAARNYGLHNALEKGYTAYCDADDVWMPNHLEQCVAALDEGADLVYSNPICVNEQGMQVFPNFPVYEHFYESNLRKNNCIWISTVVHKGKIGFFDSNLDSLEDYDMWIRVIKLGFVFKQLDKPSCYYLVKSTGMASKGNTVLKKLKIKHIDFMTPIKLQLGCGDQYLEDFINCDLYAEKVDLRFDAAKIALEDNSVDEIMAYHLLEHFDFMQGQDVVKEWYRVLKSGGRLHLEVPDFLNTCKRFAEGTEEERITLYGHFWAWPWLPGQQHKFGYTETQLSWLLTQTGFKNIRRLPPDSIYARSGVPQDLFLNLEAYK